MTTICPAIGLRCTAIPDSRPPAVRWFSSDRAYASGPPLPLEGEHAVLDAPSAHDDRLLDGDDRRLEGFVRLLLGALLDAIQGRRPTTQLVRWVSDEVIADLVLRARLHQRAPVPLAVRSFRVQRLDPRFAEVSARVRVGSGYGAAALRLERVGDRWMCRVADFGPVPGGAVTRPFRGTA